MESLNHSIILRYPPKASVIYLHFVHDLFRNKKFFQICQKIGKRFVILSDKNVASLYKASLIESMEKQGFSPFFITIEVGERQKNRKTKEQIEDKMLMEAYGRDSCLIAMGGGVVMDLAGFVAATYCRGIPYLTIPTSLLGMVDASIGGKTGVNVKYGKNLIGALYPPCSIFIDPSMLNTLPDKEMRDGIVEIIKYGLIFHRRLFYDIVDNLDKWQCRDLNFIKKIIIKSSIIKKKIIEVDFEDIGMRRILNFGHTIGHAIEMLEAYRISHGEALAMGIMVESFISQKMGGLQHSDCNVIYHLIKTLGFSLSLSKKVRVCGMFNAMKIDKKSQCNHPRFVLLDGIGKSCSFEGEYCTRIDTSMLRDALEWMVKEFS